MVSQSFNTSVVDIRHVQSILANQSDTRRIFDDLTRGEKKKRDEDMHYVSRVAIAIACVAEKLYQTARKAGEYGQKHEGCVEYYSDLKARDGAAKARESLYNSFVDHNDERFAAIGRDDSTPSLRKAREAWLAAQMYLNNELASIAAECGLDDAAKKTPSIGGGYADGFKRMAGNLYVSASEMLAHDNHPIAAAKLKSIGRAILNYGIDLENPVPSPADCISHMAKSGAKAHAKGDGWKEKIDFLDKTFKATAAGPAPDAPKS